MPCASDGDERRSPQRPDASPQTTQFIVRASPLVRLYGAWVVIVGLAWMAIGFLAAKAEGGGLGRVPSGALAAAYGVRVFRARVVARPEEVRIYNRLRNYRVERRDVRAVELRRIPGTIWQMLRLPRPQRTVGVLVVRTKEPIQMYATERSDYGVLEPVGQPANAQQVDALRDYLQPPPPDTPTDATSKAT